MSTATLGIVSTIVQPELSCPTKVVVIKAPEPAALWSERPSTVRTIERLLYVILALGYLIVVAWFAVLFVTSR